MATEHIEIERKFDVEEAYTLPDLTAVDGVASVGPVAEHHLQASYYDTADLRLLRAKVTLRRRVGGPDEGWHVKLPVAAGTRRELQSPLGRAVKAPPKAVLDPVLGLVRRAPAAVVATLTTRRLVTPLLSAEGTVLAEVANDHVTGTALSTSPGAAAVVTTWREIEVELVEGDEELLAKVSAELVVSGARPSTAQSKVGRVLDDRLAALDDPAVAVEAGVEGDAEPAGEAPSAGDAGDAGDEQPVAGAPGKKAKKTAAAEKAAAKSSKGRGKGKGKGKKARGEPAAPVEVVVPPSAGEVVVAAIEAQFAAMQRADLMVRTDQPDGVHQVRVAARRLRSILAAFRPVIERTVTDPVRVELQWLGAELSGTRDAEVSLGHLRELVAGQPEELVIGPVAARLQQAELAATVGPASSAGVSVLREQRYLRLLDAVAALAEDPPLTDQAAEPATGVLAAVVARTVHRLRRDVRVARDAADAQAHDLALHEVRKAAKRVRYTADVAAGELGDPVRELTVAAKAVQEVLGDRQDTVVTREQCRQLGMAAFGAGENPWTYGRLYTLEEARAAERETDFWALWPTLRPVLDAVR